MAVWLFGFTDDTYHHLCTMPDQHAEVGLQIIRGSIDQKMLANEVIPVKYLESALSSSNFFVHKMYTAVGCDEFEQQSASTFGFKQLFTQELLLPIFV